MIVQRGGKGVKRKALIVIVGSVDSGKTTLISKLLNIKIEEFKDITQRSDFYFMNNTILVDTPGHTDFEFDQNFYLDIADTIIVTCDQKKIPVKYDFIISKYTEKIVLAWTKNDIDPRDSKIENVNNLYLPQDLEFLKELIISVEFQDRKEKGIILNRNNLSGIGKGYEILEIENSDLYFNQIKVENLKKLSSSLNKKLYHPNVSFWISNEEVNKLPCFLYSEAQISKKNSNFYENISDLNFTIRATSWGQIYAVENMIKRLISDNISIAFFYNGIGKLESNKIPLIKEFNLIIIEYFVSKEGYKNLYDIETMIKKKIRNFKISKLVAKSKLKVEKIFEKEKNRPRILGVELRSGTLNVGDFIFINDNFYKIIKMTEKGRSIDNPAVLKKVALLLDNDEFNLRRNENILGFESKAKIDL